MSMLDAFFNKGFKGARCKTLLKLTIPRLKLLRNRREIQLKQMRREIAKLLENGQEATARIRVEHIIREENMMGAQEIIELFCELIAVRLPIIETQRECPLDLKEAISSICFAAPRCSDLPELQQVQMLFAAKYGKEFVVAATELMPDCGVNRQIIELLSVRAPSVEAKLKLLKEIAEEHELDWDPASSETEFLKPHEDLLNGPNHLIGGSTLPSPNEKHEESISSDPVKESDKETVTDADFDSLDLPEVPRVAVRTSSDNPSAPEGVLGPDASSDHSKPYHEIAKLASQDIPYGEPKVIDNLDPSLASAYAPPNDSLPTENKQFIPFVSAPSFSSASLTAKQSDAPPSLPHASLSMKQSVAPPFPQNKSNHDLDGMSPPSVLSTVKQTEPAPSYSQSKCEVNVDLQDVLAAAQAAAETAERAAQAARAAASLAQVRISALVTKRSNEISGSYGNQLQEEDPQLETTKKQTFDQQNSFGYTSHIPGYEPAWSSGSPTAASNSEPKMVVESPKSKARNDEHLSAHQPQRLPSLDDEPYFSYPNLFTSQNSSPKSDEHSFTENSKSTL